MEKYVWGILIASFILDIFLLQYQSQNKNKNTHSDNNIKQSQYKEPIKQFNTQADVQPEIKVYEGQKELKVNLDTDKKQNNINLGDRLTVSILYW
jgi:hypothetical protein